MENMPMPLAERQAELAKGLLRLFAVEALNKKQKLAMTRLWVLAEKQIELEEGSDKTALKVLEEKLRRTDEGKQLLESRILSPLKELIKENSSDTRRALDDYIIKKGLIK